MTEDEAKTKWCPFALFAENDSHGANRWDMGANPLAKWGTSTNPTPCRCIASECMAWVWNYNVEKGEVVNLTGHCGMVKS